ncbi:ABC transporter substrate-binding protein [Thalassotalea sp. PLHSN55]|uniref:ABC transporter substrate-binding protein n=1 Tax=Thalassotalea sp. PLHSN55 TaxID=3435888 RepID=UPI003F847041
MTILNRQPLLIKTFTLLSSLVFVAQAYSSQIELFHFWHQKNELQAVDVLKKFSEERGYKWKDHPNLRGQNEKIFSLLQNRLLAGTPPTAAHITAPNVNEWQKLGMLRNVTLLAEKRKWLDVWPNTLKTTFIKNNEISAIPISIHRVNWMWINLAIFKTDKMTPPKTFDELLTLAKVLHKKGVKPIALQNTAEQNFALFELIALATLGPDSYSKAFIDLNSSTLSSPKMKQTFDRIRLIQPYLHDFSALENKLKAPTTNDAIGAFSHAAIQLGGDWIKADLIAGGLKPQSDFLCLPSPGTAGTYSFHSDSIAFFKLRPKATDKQSREAQHKFLDNLLKKNVQHNFNLKKGSIPVRQDISLALFDSCAQQSSYDFNQAERNETLVPSLSQGMANNHMITINIKNLVHRFFNDKSMTSNKAINTLSQLGKST